jgi:hypothetical protein
MNYRGIYNFEVTDDGNIIYSRNNVELLRKLWLDREIISPAELGHGDEGDFDNGAWHIACHLVAAGGVRKTNNNQLIWLEISFNPETNLYFPSLTTHYKNEIITIPLISTQAKEYIKNSNVVGFVEGTSEGRISANGIIDDKDLFNGTPRQEYNQLPGSTKEGGKVWEHWCTTRDIRIIAEIGTSVLDSYIALVEVCGNNFISTVARGRTDYSHPSQLYALIKAGFTTKESALLNIQPTLIPEKQELLFQNATPESSFLAVEQLEWKPTLSYYMFSRCISHWNNTLLK